MNLLKIHILCWAVIFAPFFSYAQMKINAVQVGSKIDVTIGDRFFTSYITSADEKYPFLFPVNGPVTGSSVTSMRNGEYPHHSSLFFGCDRVNGGNYWQEGLERGQIISKGAKIVEQGDRVVITDECEWLRPDAESPVRDTRKIIITAPSKDLWQIDFDITVETLMDVVIEKTNHSLFSVRTAFDISVLNGGVMINAEGAQGEQATFGKKSAWIDFYGKRADSMEGIAIMQHPSNEGYPAPWFTRDYGFMSPTPMYWPPNDQDISLSKGEKITLRYRVLVHAGDHRSANIALQYEKYKNE
ncbi:MAG: PmoA family protein [Tannerella sp.]|jgi:hypothetical protein|nr:PmoA family protein [Tannerella sp.]